jgi:glycosyltransferase involved in cell wall biosynthesis
MLSLTYNKEALDRIEIIIVNDGSSDSTLSVAQKYEKKYPQSVIVVDKKNGGHGSTINAGLERATGKYFRVVDSDDWVNIDDFGSFIFRLANSDTDIVVTNYSREMVYSGKNELVRYKSLKYDHVYDFDKFEPRSLGNDYFYMATSTIKTDKLRKAGLVLDEHTFYVDMEYVVLSIAHLSSFEYWDFDIYRYWIGRPQQSIDTRNIFRNRGHHEKVLQRLINFYTHEKQLNANKREYVRKIIVLMLNTHYFIYCSQRVSHSDSKEIVSFDRWLNNASRELYIAVSDKFRYIKYYRNTRFVFTYILPGFFRRITRRLEKIQDNSKREESKLS